jgi:hypothetical protein
MCYLARHDVPSPHTGPDCHACHVGEPPTMEGKTRLETRQYGSGTTCLLDYPDTDQSRYVVGAGKVSISVSRPSKARRSAALCLSNQDTLLTSSHAETSEMWCCSCCRNQPMSERFALAAARIIVARSLAAFQVAAGDQDLLVQGFSHDWVGTSCVLR